MSTETDPYPAWRRMDATTRRCVVAGPALTVLLALASLLAR